MRKDLVDDEWYAGIDRSFGDVRTTSGNVRAEETEKGPDVSKIRGQLLGSEACSYLVLDIGKEKGGM